LGIRHCLIPISNHSQFDIIYNRVYNTHSLDSTQNLEGIVVGKDQDYWLSALINSPIYSKFPKCLSKDILMKKSFLDDGNIIVCHKEWNFKMKHLGE